MHALQVRFGIYFDYFFVCDKNVLYDFDYFPLKIDFNFLSVISLE